MAKQIRLDYLDHLNIGLISIDGDAMVNLINDRAIALLGLQKGIAYIGRPIARVLPESAIAEVLERDCAIEKRKLQIAATGKTVIINSFPVHEQGRIIGAIETLQDITDIESAARQLDSYKRVQAEMDEILDNASDGIFVTDQNGIIQYINSTSRKFIGIGERDVIGEYVGDLQESGFFQDSAILKAIESGKQESIVQKSKYHLLVTAKPIFDERGAIKRVVCSSRDVGEINLLRDELMRTREIASYYQAKLEQVTREQDLFSKIIHHSAAMKAVIDMVSRTAGYDTSILFLGESGVGKNVLAKLLHQLSPRSKGEFVEINCGAIPENLLESELFGYAEGAFTGAKAAGHVGKIELAHRGTLFLDEVAEMPALLQTKLLHVLNDKRFARVGSNKVIEADFRLLTATNRDLQQRVREGKFREDLYYRINVIQIAVPPLRERGGDIPFLLTLYLDRLNERYGLRKAIDYKAMELLEQYRYPGNVRELINIIEYLYVITEGETISVEAVGKVLRTEKENAVRIGDSGELAAGALDFHKYKETVENYERVVFTELYRQYKSSYKIADLLGISQSTASRKLRKYL